MFKNIMVTGILLITISVLNAKSIETSNGLISTSLHSSNEEALADKLAADKDFKKYYISNVEFANKVIESRAGDLFLKYIQNKISAEESAILFAKMNVTGKAAFDAIAVKFRNEALAFFNKFPELKLKPEKEQKEVLFNAFKKISADRRVAIKFLKARTISVEECFWSWMVCNSLCAISCTYEDPPNYSACVWQCGAACSVAYGFCWFLATE